MSNIFNTAVAAIARLFSGLFRSKVETKLGPIPQADNDNGLKARLRGSTAGIYRVAASGKRSLAIHVCPVEAARVGLKVGDRVAVEMLGEDFIIRPATKRGATIKADKNSLVIRAAMRDAPLTGAFRVTLSRMDDGAVLVRRHGGGDGGGETVPAEVISSDILPESFLDGFKSLQGAAGKKRLAYLAANDNQQQEQSTTPAGDACFTGVFFAQAVLAALGRSEFDVDFCSMRSDGRYDQTLDPKVVAAATWKLPNNPAVRVPVIGPIPAARYMTKAETKYGSLLRPWIVDAGWLNPPYSKRIWAVFLEKAAKEVAAGRAGIIVALVPMDTYGAHIRHMYGQDVHRIELAAKVPFFKVRTSKKNRKTDEVVVRENVVEDIKGNSLVIFGKGIKTRDFLLRLLNELLAIGYITEEQVAHHRTEFSVWPNLQEAA